MSAIRTGAAPASARALLLAIVIVVTSIGGVLLTVLYPETDADDRFSYAVVQPAREHFWAWHVFGPANLVIGVCAVAVAGVLLTPGRGAWLGTLGAAAMWLGAAFYGTGVAGLGPVHYFGTEPEAIDRAAGMRLIAYVNDDGFWRLWGPALAGAVLVTVGTVVLAVGLWRARTVPRWVPVVAAVSILATFVVGGTALVAQLLVDAAVAASSIAIGWYAWKSAQGRALAPVGH